MMFFRSRLVRQLAVPPLLVLSHAGARKKLAAGSRALAWTTRLNCNSATFRPNPAHYQPLKNNYQLLSQHFKAICKNSDHINIF